MQQLSQDLKTLILNNWKTILAIVVIFYLLYSYSNIKQGIVDAWMNQ